MHAVPSTFEEFVRLLIIAPFTRQDVPCEQLILAEQPGVLERLHVR